MAPGSDAIRYRLDMEPIPCPRPRASKWGMYYPKSYALWKQLARAALMKARVPLGDGPYAVTIECVAAQPKKTKLAAPRGDVDNYAKSVLDALTSASCWDDDNSVTALEVTKAWSEPGEPGHITITITTDKGRRKSRHVTA